MAEKKHQGQVSPVYGWEDGYLAVRALEDNTLDQLLTTYGARADGYKIDAGENFNKVTMKITFPLTPSKSNAELWAWFIATAAHPTCKKSRQVSVPEGEGWTVYVSWAVWNNVKYMESKRQDNPLF